MMNKNKLNSNVAPTNEKKVVKLKINIKALAHHISKNKMKSKKYHSACEKYMKQNVSELLVSGILHDFVEYDKTRDDDKMNRTTMSHPSRSGRSVDRSRSGASFGSHWDIDESETEVDESRDIFFDFTDTDTNINCRTNREYHSYTDNKKDDDLRSFCTATTATTMTTKSTIGKSRHSINSSSCNSSRRFDCKADLAITNHDHHHNQPHNRQRQSRRLSLSFLARKNKKCGVGSGNCRSSYESSGSSSSSTIGSFNAFLNHRTETAIVATIAETMNHKKQTKCTIIGGRNIFTSMIRVNSMSSVAAVATKQHRSIEINTMVQPNNNNHNCYSPDEIKKNARLLQMKLMYADTINVSLSELENRYHHETLRPFIITAKTEYVDVYKDNLTGSSNDDDDGETPLKNLNSSRSSSMAKRQIQFCHSYSRNRKHFCSGDNKWVNNKWKFYYMNTIGNPCDLLPLRPHVFPSHTNSSRRKSKNAFTNNKRLEK